FRASGGSGPESLHGVKIGDARADVEERLKMPVHGGGNPFDPQRTNVHQGVVLRQDDLNLSEGELRRLVTLSTDGNKPTMVMFHKGRAVAVISHDHSARTSRGVRVGDSVGRVYDLYPEGGESKDVKISDGTHVEVRRYDELGVGFEIRKSRVTAVTIYPPK